MPLNLLKATHFNFKSIYRLTTFPKISILKLEKFSSVIRTPEVCWASDWEGIINNWLLTGGLRAFKAISLQLTNTSSGPVSGSLGSPSQPLERPLAVSLKHQTDKWIIRVVPPWTLLHELYRILIFQQYLIENIWSSSKDLQMFHSLKMTPIILSWCGSLVRINPLVAVKFCCYYWLWWCQGVSETCLLSS